MAKLFIELGEQPNLLAGLVEYSKKNKEAFYAAGHIDNIVDIYQAVLSNTEKEKLDNGFLDEYNRLKNEIENYNATKYEITDLSLIPEPNI